MRGRLGNRFRLIRKRMKRRMKRIRKNTSRTSPFSMTISTSISITITLISTFNLNLTLFEPHPTPPFHSPRTPHSPLSSPYPLSPHSIPLVTFNFTSITFCYESKSPWAISLAISVITSSISISFVMTNTIKIIIMTSSISNANPKNLWSKFWSLTNSYTTSITSSISMTNSNC